MKQNHPIKQVPLCFRILLAITTTLLFTNSHANHRDSNYDASRSSQLSSEPTRFRGMVALHNQVRANHGLPPLKWSARLAGYAREWANELANNHNCSMMHRPQHGQFKQRFGENLFWASPEHWSNGEVRVQKLSPTEVVNAWAEEKEFYDYRTNRCVPGEDCGHYTQIVWRESQNVGCAIAVCQDKSQLWACNYDPPGNYIGERPY